MENYNYSSISAFLEESEKAPHKINYLESSNTFREGFNDSQDWNQAQDWILNGRNDLEKFELQALDNEFSSIKNEFCLNQTLSVCGAYINIGEYVTGSPENMNYFETIQAPRISKLINITVNTTVSCKVKNDDILRASKEILKAIYLLELQGCSTAVTCFTHIRDKGKRTNQDFKFSIDVKKQGEPLNPNCFFSVVSTDFVRRLYFRFTERLLKGESKKFPTTGRGNCLMNEGDIILNKVITDSLTYIDIVKRLKNLNTI